jgi:competence protein ComEA
MYIDNTLTEVADDTTDAAMLVKADTVMTSEVRPTTTQAAAAQQVAVDVIGAVQQPGVYYLEGKPRVVDAVQAAGGLAPDAARDEINLAAAVVDGTQIRVPHVGEVPAEVSAASDTTASGMVNINNADVAALDSLPGIGPTTAQAVIEQRTKDGPFAKIEDIQNVKGIGPSLFAQIKTRITVGP